MKKKTTRWQKFGLIASAVSSLLLVFRGLYLLCFTNHLLSPAFAVTFFVLPLVTAALIWLLILWRKKVWVRITLAVLILAPLLFFWFITAVLGTFHEQTLLTGAEALAAYSEKSYPEGMPDDLGSPTDVLYVNHVMSCMIFQSDCDSLILTYTPEEYGTRTAALNSQNIFHTSPLLPSDGVTDTEFHWENWYFRYLNMDGTNLLYPKEMILVGTNDSECTISYVYFTDIDLDYITSHEEFLLDDCGWSYLP